MSTPPSGRPVDLDTLADYLDDLLPEAETATVADLVANDPAWADTLAALRSAQPRVAAVLSAATPEAGPMPADVLSRIDRLQHTPKHAPTVVYLNARRRSRLHRTVRSDWLKAAAALIVVVVGLGFLVQHARTDRSHDSKAASALAGAAPAPALPTRSGLTISASGTDYTRADLTQPASASGATKAPAITVPHPAASAFTFRSPRPATSAPVPAALRALSQPPALDNCLNAVETLTGGTPASVDFASYQGQPALIITFRDLPTAIAVGPTCGTPGSGADVLSRG